MTKIHAEKTPDRRILPWLTVLVVNVFALLNMYLIGPPWGEDLVLQFLLLGLAFGFLLPNLFAVLGAVIISRQAANRVGWLMVIAAFGFVIPDFASLAPVDLAAPGPLTPGQLLVVWLSGWVWLVPILASVLIVLHFPDGRPPSPRWAWVGRLAVGAFIYNVVFSGLFTADLVVDSTVVENPFMSLAPGIRDGFLGIGVIGSFLSAGGSIVSLLYRFRRARPIQREQIKWLLFAGALFLLSFILITVTYETRNELWALQIFTVSFLLIPLSIAIAILRYRLYDINLIIRGTLLYGLLTGTLALVFFGSVVLLQRLIPAQNQLSTVLSTLAIAALFAPLRGRIQRAIDRRFFRQRYDAAQTLASFTARARDQVDLDQLNHALVEVVKDSMQPASVSLWLRDADAG